MGAIASGGVRVLNEDVVNFLQIPLTVIDTVAAREQQERGQARAAETLKVARQRATESVRPILDGIACINQNPEVGGKAKPPPREM